MEIKIYYDKRLEINLHYLKNALGKERKLKFRKKKSFELNNLNKYVKYGFIDTNFGIYFKYSYKKFENYIINSDNSITQREWDSNKIILLEQDFKSRKHFFKISFLFLNLVLNKFKKSGIKGNFLFSLTFMLQEYDNIFNKADFVNSVCFRMYKIRENDEIFDYKNLNDNNNSVGETICIVVENL